ncbi:MAG TPA: type II toxin-antitoxin system death-on-curing family toxin [Candidatus Obscuribacterales bacterium]
MKHLDKEQILDLHSSVLDPGEPGNWDEDRLESVMYSIQGGAYGQLFHPTIVEAGAAYLYYFARSQVFAQGNKRTAVATCDLFLDVNRLPLPGDLDDEFVVDVAIGAVSKQQAIDYLRTLTSTAITRPGQP